MKEKQKSLMTLRIGPEQLAARMELPFTGKEDYRKSRFVRGLGRKITSLDLDMSNLRCLFTGKCRC